jgi:hypothetical protein
MTLVFHSVLPRIGFWHNHATGMCFRGHQRKGLASGVAPHVRRRRSQSQDPKDLPRVLTGVHRCNFNNLRNLSKFRKIRSLDDPIPRFSQ